MGDWEEVRMKIRLFVCAVAGVFLAGLLSSRCVYSAENELPKIVQWKNGNGLDKNGTIITDTWAYDNVNPAGKYVLFGESGEVLRKQESMEGENILDEGYTMTELKLGQFAIRCDVFPGFSGTVDVVMQEKSGNEVGFSLGQECRYEGNLFMGTGIYHILDAHANWGNASYRVSFPEIEYDMTEGKVILVRMEVMQETEYLADETETGDQEDKQSEIAETEMPKKESGEETGAAEREVKTEMPMKRIIVFGGAIMAGFLSLAWLRKRKSKA